MMRDAAQTGQTVSQDSEWARIEGLPVGEREAAMRVRYEMLAAQQEEERRATLHSMALVEYALPDDRLKSFTHSRMKVLLSMDDTAARLVVTSYDAVMNAMPGTVAMRRVAMVQTLAREFSGDEERRLRDLVPGIFSVPIATVFATPAQQKPPRPWWAFWQSG